MNPVVLLALVGGGYVLYQQSQGKSLFGGEECPAKIEVDGSAFARELIPGYENGGVVTKALNDAGIVLAATGGFDVVGKKAEVKKFTSANYTKKLADQAFRKLVPSGCKKSDKGTVVCLALATVPGTDTVAMAEMHLPTFWLMIHSLLIGTFGELFAELAAAGEDGMEAKLAKCQALLGKELEWWRKTMGTQGDLPEDIAITQVPRGNHNPAEIPGFAIDDLLQGSGSGGGAGRYGPMGGDGVYAMTAKVNNALEDRVSKMAIESKGLSASSKSELLGSVSKMRPFMTQKLQELASAYNDASIGQAITKDLSLKDSSTPFEMEGPGATLVQVSPSAMYLTLMRFILESLEGVNSSEGLSAPSKEMLLSEAVSLYGPNLQTKVGGDLILIQQIVDLQATA